jgi:hypothetical protein
MFLKLLPNLVNLLLPSQTLLVLHLLEPALLKRRIRSLKPALGVAVQLVFVVGCNVQRIQRVVDA